MDLDRARFLVSPRGRAALAAVAPGAGRLAPTALATLLRRSHPAAEAAAIAEQLSLRDRGRDKLGEQSTTWLLTREGLEMMTHPGIAARRASRLRELDLPVADLTCGLGGDLRPAAEMGMRAAGFDLDAATTILAAANVPGAMVGRADAARPAIDLKRSAVVIDPSRRGSRGRTFDPLQFSPPWNAVLAVAESAVAAVIKAPPGIDHAALPPSAEAEFVQFGRVLRECACWLGRGSTPGLRRAVILPSAGVIDSTAPAVDATTHPPGPFLLDPQSCVTRAGLVRQLAHRVGARLMDPSVAYLASDLPVADPLCEAFQVVDVVEFSLLRLRRRLRSSGLAVGDVRRRAFPVEPEDLRKQLGRLPGDPVTLLCTTLLGRRVVFIARKVA